MSNSAFGIFLSRIRQLGKETQQQWEQYNYDESKFSEICYTQLQKFGKNSEFVLENLLEELVLSNELTGIQKNHSFSQMQVTLFQEENFYIELLTWTEGSTSTHDHSFSGAFLVLQGMSFHSQYKFLASQAINSRLQVGNLELLNSELLHEGAVREIKAGHDFIHSVFHLSLPTCTLVLRTNIEKNYLPQLDYKGIHIAHSPGHVTFKQKHIIQSLNVAKKWEEKEFELYLKNILSSVDVETLFIILNGFIHDASNVQLSLVENILSDYEYGKQIFTSLMEERAKRNFSKLKNLFRKVNERILLAAVIFLKNPHEILNFYKKNYNELWEEELRGSLRSLLSMSPSIDKKLIDNYAEKIIAGGMKSEELVEFNSMDETTKFLLTAFIQDRVK